MTLQQIDGNILDITEGIICHQVNCRGVMGAGIAKAIRNKYPLVFDLYIQACKRHEAEELLGTAQIVKVSDTLRVVNMFGQVGYGRSGRFTNYGAVGESFRNLWDMMNKNNIDRQVYIPYRMGCGLAGGDWEIYQEIAYYHIPDAIVVKLP